MILHCCTTAMEGSMAAFTSQISICNSPKYLLHNLWRTHRVYNPVCHKCFYSTCGFLGVASVLHQTKSNLHRWFVCSIPVGAMYKCVYYISISTILLYSNMRRQAVSILCYHTYDVTHLNSTYLLEKKIEYPTKDITSSWGGNQGVTRNAGISFGIKCPFW